MLILLALLVSTLGAAGQDEGESETGYRRRWSLVDEEIAALRQSRSEEAPWSKERLQYVYTLLLRHRAHFPDEWGDRPAFEILVEEVFELGGLGGPPGHDLSLIDYGGSYEFELAGRIPAARQHLNHTVRLHDESAQYLPQIHTQLAVYARLCREWRVADQHLTAAAECLARRPEGPEKDRGLIELGLERARQLIGRGRPDQAADQLREAWQLALEIEDEDLRLELLGSGLIEELNIYLTFDSVARARQALERIQQEGWYDDLPEWSRVACDLRLAIVSGESRREDPAHTDEAIAELIDVLESPALGADDRNLGLLRLADLELGRGFLDRAAQRLEEVSLALAGDRASSPNSPLTTREIDLRVLRGQLALARGVTGEELAELVEPAREIFERMILRWLEVPESEGGLSLTMTRGRRAIPEVLVRLLLAADEDGGPERALEVVNRLQIAGSLARAMQAPQPSIEEVRTRLVPANGGLLVLLPGNVESIALGVDRATTAAFHLPPIEKLDELRRELIEALDLSLQEGVRTARLDRIVERLSAALLSTELIEKLSTWSSLVVVGLDGVGYLPFELLEEAPGAALGDRLALSYLPSLPIGLELATHPPGDPVRGLLVLESITDPAPAPGGEAPAPLPFDGSAREMLRRAWGSAVEFRGGPAVSLEGLEGERLTDLAALQLIAHGVASGRADRPRGLLLHGGEVLTPGSIERGPRLPSLVVLNACGTWRGPLRRGDDGRHHLVGAFFLAGARALVTSQTQVDYRLSMEQTAAFHEALVGAGRDPAAAMLAARRRVAGSAGFHRHLLHVVGLGHETPVLPAVVTSTAGGGTEDERGWGAYLVLAVVILGGTFAAVWRRRRQPAA